MTINAPTTEAITIQVEGMTLSSLIWQRFKRQMPGLLELTMETNRDIEEDGTELVVGTVVLLPIPIPREEQSLEAIKLF